MGLQRGLGDAWEVGEQPVSSLGRIPLMLLGGLGAIGAALIAMPVFSSRLDPSATTVSPPVPAQAYLGRLLDEPEDRVAAAGQPSAPPPVMRFRGRLDSGLESALEDGGVPAEVAQRFVATIAGRAAGLDIGADDHFDLVVDHSSPGGPTLVYAALDRVGASDVQLIRLGGAWVEAGGADGKTARPVPGRLTSRYGLRRHPLLGYSRMHRGVDFAAAHGAPVKAASAGRVVGAGWAGGYGRQVRIVHGGGLSSSYSHLSGFAVASGGFVRAGQVIGYAGSSGLSTGPHVHYEVRRNGVSVDPLGTALKGGSSLDSRTQAQLRDRIGALLSIAPQPRG